MGEKTASLARSGCSTQEHIRAIDGSVPVEEASNLHAGPCQAEMTEIEVLSMLCVPQLTLACQYFGRESMLIRVHASKFRKNQIFRTRITFSCGPRLT